MTAANSPSVLDRVRSLLSTPTAAPMLAQMESQEVDRLDARRAELVAQRAKAQRALEEIAPGLAKKQRDAEAALTAHDAAREKLVAAVQGAVAAKSSAMHPHERAVIAADRELERLAPPSIATFIESCEEAKQEVFRAGAQRTGRTVGGKEVIVAHNGAAVDAAVQACCAAIVTARELIFSGLRESQIADRLGKLAADLPDPRVVAESMVDVKPFPALPVSRR